MQKSYYSNKCEINSLHQLERILLSTKPTLRVLKWEVLSNQLCYNLQTTLLQCHEEKVSRPPNQNKSKIASSVIASWHAVPCSIPPTLCISCSTKLNRKQDSSFEVQKWVSWAHTESFIMQKLIECRSRAIGSGFMLSHIDSKAPPATVFAFALGNFSAINSALEIRMFGDYARNGTSSHSQSGFRHSNHARKRQRVVSCMTSRNCVSLSPIHRTPDETRHRVRIMFR